RGDTSGWTDTPAQAKARAAQKYIESYEATLRLEASEAQAKAAAEKTAKMVDSYNDRQRPKTLLEMHQDKQKKVVKDEKKAKKKQKTTDPHDQEWKVREEPEVFWKL
ncbi:hypothetical protein CYMTET_18445, partial [Cymbomonas tetramitiformis]